MTRRLWVWALSVTVLACTQQAIAQSCREQALHSRIATCWTTQGACTGTSGTNCVADVHCSGATNACLRAIPTDRFSIYKTYYCDNLASDNLSESIDEVVQRICPDEKSKPALPQPQAGASADKLAMIVAVTAAAAALLLAREPSQADAARAAKQLSGRRSWAILGSCKENARDQARAIMKSDPRSIDEFWVDADTMCACFGPRALVTFSEAELQQLTPDPYVVAWSRIPHSRVLEAFLPCTKVGADSLVDLDNLMKSGRRNSQTK